MAGISVRRQGPKPGDYEFSSLVGVLNAADIKAKELIDELGWETVQVTKTTSDGDITFYYYRSIP